MKKIALLINDISRMGGAERVASNMANALVNYYEVNLISLVHEFEKIPYELDSRIGCTFLLNGKNYRVRELVTKTRKKLRKLLKEKQIETLLCIGVYAGVVGSINAFDLKTKVFFCDHSSVRNQLKDKQLTLGRRVSSLLSKYTVVLTKDSLDDYVQYFRTPKKKLIQIYNWIDDKVFERAKSYDENSHKIISVGRIEKEKGFDMVVQIAKELKKMNSNWQWDIYGEGSQKNKIEVQIKENELTEYVFFKGQENLIYDKYGGYSMLVLPSYREGLGMVLLEAQVNHLPVLSFDIVTGPAEIIVDSQNGFLVKPYDIKQMAQRMCELLENKELRIKFSQNAYLKIEKFEKVKILNQWIELIRNVDKKYRKGSKK